MGPDMTRLGQFPMKLTQMGPAVSAEAWLRSSRAIKDGFGVALVDGNARARASRGEKSLAAL